MQDNKERRLNKEHEPVVNCEIFKKLSKDENGFEVIGHADIIGPSAPKPKDVDVKTEIYFQLWKLVVSKGKHMLGGMVFNNGEIFLYAYHHSLNIGTSIALEIRKNITGHDSKVYLLKNGISVAWDYRLDPEEVEKIISREKMKS